VFGRIFKFLDGAGGGSDGAPADSVFSGDDDAAANVLCVGDDFSEQIGLRFGIVGVEHCGAYARREFFSF
jgi:hypothetical protein